MRTSRADPFALLRARSRATSPTVWLNLVCSPCCWSWSSAISMAWDFTEHWGEYYALLLWATVGMMLLIAAEELLTSSSRSR